MLKSLYIKNYAIIEEITLQFPDGLTIITGETGSGKSIMLGALGLILGDRADSDKLYHKASKCIVEAQYDLRRYNLQGFFTEHDFDYDDELILRREISPKGKSRAFINDTPALLKDLRLLGKQLIQQHRQFDTMEITESTYQLKLLDAMAEQGDLLHDYSLKYREREELLSSIKAIEEQRNNALKEQDYIAFQLQEIEELQLDRAEVSTIDAEYQRLQHADDIVEILSSFTGELTEGDYSILDRIRGLRSNLDKLDTYLPEGSEIIKRLEAGILELEDLGQYAIEIGESVEREPEKLELISAQIDGLQRLVKKHQLESYEEIFDLKEELEASLTDIEESSERLEEAERHLRKLDKTLELLADELHKNRKALLPELEKAVKEQLSLLAMPYGQFKIELEQSDELGRAGKDKAHFLFNANKGGELQELKQVASGGEMSRLALVLSSLVAKSMTLPTLIFDEIDSGVSGDVALKMGKILKELSQEHQVIVITHSPQIAAQGDVHYYVSKRVDENRTYAEINMLKDAERTDKIAIMLSQKPPTEAARKNAEELLNYKFI